MTRAQTAAFTGVSGVFATPDALIAKQGSLSYQYNNFIEPGFLAAHDSGTNHVFTLGVFERVELGGRLTDFDPLGEKYNVFGARNGVRDLSANLKFNLYSRQDRLWVSFGAVDVGGLAQKFSSQYGVISGRLGAGILSAGYAVGESDTFDGLFVNARYKVNPYLTLAAEMDTREAIGMGLIASLPVTRQLTFDASISRNEQDTQVGLTARYQYPERSLAASVPVFSEAADDTNTAQLQKFADALVADDFQHIKVGSKPDNHFIAQVENRLYTHTDFDAISSVTSIAAEHLPARSTLEITLTDQRLPKFRVSVLLPAYKEPHLAQASVDEAQKKETHNLDSSASANTIANGVVLAPLPVQDEYSNLTWYQPAYPSKPSRVDLSLKPALVSAVGTEFGTIDFSLAANLSMSIPLWKGAQLVVNSLLPVADTRNFEEGRPFGPQAFKTSIERALFLQNLPPVKNIYSQLELGKVQIRGFDYTAFKLQAAWQSRAFPLLLHASAGQYSLRDSDTDRPVVLASASYSFDRYKSVVKATYGQFLFGEHAVNLTATRRFGNSFFSLFLKVIDNEDLAGGMRISTPIGPRKGVRWKQLTFTGERWSTGLQTTIKFPDDNSNRLQTTFLLEPLKDSEIPQRLLDSGRLNQHYLRAVNH